MRRRDAWSLLLGVLVVADAGCKAKGSPTPPPAASRPATPRPIELAMIAIPAGTFAMGAADGDDDARPVHDERVEAFAMGRTDVTVAEYARCVAAAACTSTPTKPYCNETEPGRDAHPMNCVTWAQANAFCAWAQARLPSEIEWEYAARGADGRRYPWGNAPPGAQLCWDGKKSDVGPGKRRGTCPVDGHPGGAGPFGMLDLAGNVWQWTSDLASDDYESQRLGPKRIVRGGTWYAYDAKDVRSTLRFRQRAETADYGVGFRCAR